MKTTKIILTLAVAVVVAAFNTSLQAAQPFLSPRASENQTRTVSGVTENRLDRADLFKHKGDLVAHARVAGVSMDRDLVRESRGLIGSPKALAAMSPSARPFVATSAEMAFCKTMKKGECAMPCCKTVTSCKMPCC